MNNCETLIAITRSQFGDKCGITGMRWYSKPVRGGFPETVNNSLIRDPTWLGHHELVIIIIIWCTPKVGEALSCRGRSRGPSYADNHAMWVTHRAINISSFGGWRPFRRLYIPIRRVLPYYCRHIIINPFRCLTSVVAAEFD